MASQAPAERARASTSAKGIWPGRLLERLPMDRGCAGEESGRLHGRMGHSARRTRDGRSFRIHHVSLHRGDRSNHPHCGDCDCANLLPDRVEDLVVILMLMAQSGKPERKDDWKGFDQSALQASGAALMEIVAPTSPAFSLNTLAVTP